MKLGDYMPIACVLHEQYQFAVMKCAWLELDWCDDLGRPQLSQVMPKDVYTRDKAEYLLAETVDRAEVEIRLDQIHKAVWVETGETFVMG